jgi:chemotaxis protein histidine kinase CheA
MGWESDPEFGKMREDFILSFTSRREALVGPLDKLKQPIDPVKAKELMSGARIAAHNLAGSAESYGFPTLTKVAGAVDDVLFFCVGITDVERVASFIRLLDAMLAFVQERGADPAQFCEDPRMADLISFAEFLAAEAMPGSS